MSLENDRLRLPQYDAFVESIMDLSLPLSASELHGMMCGYLCAGANNQGEAYLRALLNNKKDEASRMAELAMFSIYSISQQQITHFDFDFQLLLPDDDEELPDRARAFSEWCEGFTQALTTAGVDADQFYEEETQETLQHIQEFAEIDADSLEGDEDDERALMEVSEYTRMAVLRLHSELLANEKERGGFETSH